VRERKAASNRAYRVALTAVKCGEGRIPQAQKKEGNELAKKKRKNNQRKLLTGARRGKTSMVGTLTPASHDSELGGP